MSTSRCYCSSVNNSIVKKWVKCFCVMSTKTLQAWKPISTSTTLLYLQEQIKLIVLQIIKVTDWNCFVERRHTAVGCCIQTYQEGCVEFGAQAARSLGQTKMADTCWLLCSAFSLPWRWCADYVLFLLVARCFLSQIIHDKDFPCKYKW